MRAVCNAAMALVLWLCVTIPALSAGEFEKPGALAQSLALPDGSPVHFTGLLVAVNGCVEDYLGTYSFARLRAEFTEVYD